MERNEQYYNRNYNQRQNEGENNFDRFSERYSERGNYYGMPDNNHEYRNVRMQQRNDFNDFSEGPVGGYGAGNYNQNYDRTHRNRDDHYRYGDDSNFKQNHGYSSGGDYRNSDYRNRNQNDYYSEKDYSSGLLYSSNYDVAGNRRYARQENSYQKQGYGRRYSEYGRDERRNYGHELTDIHHDRGEISDSSDNDYRRNYAPGREFDFGENKEDYRYSGRIQNTGSDRDNYATGPYASNRAYVSDHSDSDGDRYSSRENRNDRSGPDYSKWSPIGNYGYDTFGI